LVYFELAAGVGISPMEALNFFFLAGNVIVVLLLKRQGKNFIMEKFFAIYKKRGRMYYFLKGMDFNG
jgi:hypothetical protein